MVGTYHVGWISLLPRCLISSISKFSIGKAGNPDTMNGVTLTPGAEMIVGPTTDVIAGEKMIVTAGGVDTHIHFICPQQCDEAIASGVTTMYGGGTGPSAGTSATSEYIFYSIMLQRSQMPWLIAVSLSMTKQHALLDPVM